MSHGLQVFNPSGTLVVSADGMGYKYFGLATLHAAGTESFTLTTHPSVPPIDYYPGILSPYVYRVTLPNSTMVPLIGITIDSSRVTVVSRVFTLGSGVWEIEVYSSNRGSGRNTSTLIPNSPGDIYVFCPVSSVDSNTNFGLQLYDSSGNISFSSNVIPLYFKERIDCSGNSGSNLNYVGSTSWTNSSNSVLLLTSQAGSGTLTNDTAGEDVFTGMFGWTKDGTTLKREFFITQHFTRPEGVPGATYIEEHTVDPKIILVTDSSYF